MGGEFCQELERVEGSGISVARVRISRPAKRFVGAGMVIEFLERYRSFGDIVSMGWDCVFVEMGLVWVD